VLALEAVLTLALSTLIYAFSARKVVVSVLYPLLGFIALPMMTNIDAWVLAAFDNDARRYGTARSMGSLAFAIAALILGQLIAWAGYVIMLVGSLLSMGVILAVTLLLEDYASQNFDWVPAPRVRDDGIYEHGQPNRPIRVYHTLDTRMTMEDFYAKLLINYTPEYLKGVF